MPCKKVTVRFAAQVLSKIFQAVQESQIAIGIDVSQLVDKQFEPKRFDKARESVGVGGVNPDLISRE